MSIQKILYPILAKIITIPKPGRDFLIEAFTLLFSRQGKATFENLSRYSSYNELTFRRWYSRYFDWLGFNLSFVDWQAGTYIGVIDCSFITKSGKHTYGLDKFWSGCLNVAKQGLEVSVLGCINVDLVHSFVLDATQTPAGLSAKEEANYSRIDFYLEQVLDCLPQLKAIVYFVADGFYAKTKFIDGLRSQHKHIITKLRADANLYYLSDEPRKQGQRGPNKKYAGKVDCKDMSKWEWVGTDTKHAHVILYSQKLYGVHFKRIFKVVLLLNTRTQKYALLASSDVGQQARQIVEYYQLRFQIEFIFRDAKQFTGFNECQARGEEKLDFHFNLTLSAVNVGRLLIRQDASLNSSMHSLCRQQYNTRLLDLAFAQLKQISHLKEFVPDYSQFVRWGTLAA
jgi:hypothetical protein